jgi:hypothetical protein
MLPLDFQTVALSVLNMFKTSVDFDTVDVLKQLGKNPVTDSAFSQARYKNDWQFFADLCAISSEAYPKFATPRWKGYRVLAGGDSL